MKSFRIPEKILNKGIRTSNKALVSLMNLRGYQKNDFAFFTVLTDYSTNNNIATVSPEDPAHEEGFQPLAKSNHWYILKKIFIPDRIAIKGLNRNNSALIDMLYDTGEFKKKDIILFVMHDKWLAARKNYYTELDRAYGVDNSWSATEAVISHLRKLEGKE